MDIVVNDRVGFKDDKYYGQVIQKDEELYWSGESLKINKRGRIQNRIFLVTSNRVINLGKRSNFIFNLFDSLIKRQIFIKDIQAITYSEFSNNFILHVPSEYDYLLCCYYKDEIVKLLLQILQIKKILEIPIFFVEDIELFQYCQLEGEKDTKWPQANPSKMTLEKFQSYLIKKKNSIENSIRKTEILLTADDEQVNQDSFDILKTLGKGYFGKVFLAQKKSNKKLYAIKVISKVDVIKKKFFKSLQTEKEILQKVDNKFVVKMEYCFASPTYVFFAMEFKQGGELYRQLKQAKMFSEKVSKFYSAQILCGLCYLHSNDIMYRDMKPENILLDKDGNCSLADFGISKVLKENETTKSFVGTPEYVAPEIILKKGHDKSVDIWCFGVLLYEMIYGVAPFANKNQNVMLNWIIKIDPFFPKMIKISDELKDLISQCLKKNPKERIGYSNIELIKQHEWFQDTDWDKVQNLQIEPPIKININNEKDTQHFNKKTLNERNLKSNQP